MIRAPAREVDARALARPVAVVIAAAAMMWLAVVLAVKAALPAWLIAALLPSAALAMVVALFRAGVALGPLAEDERGEIRPLRRRHGFWIVAIGIVTGLPTLGACSLVDPWETHYAEVAREMIERRDFVSPWWANEGWFMSKPVLVFWLESLAMIVFGVRTGPDQVLAGAASAAARPEWAVRMPAFVLAIAGAYVLYNGVSRTCGRRAGFVGAVVLLTMPGYALLSHQAITDMPLVASIAASLGFLLRALGAREEAQVAAWTVRLGRHSLTVHAGHAVALAVLALVVPQLLVLLASHVHLGRVGADHVLAGSPHACTLPGQPACARVALAHPRLQPILQVAIWAPLLLWLIARLATETRAARLFATAAWMAAAFGAMAKGPAALVVPAAAALVAIASRRSLRPLLRLEILGGLAVVLLLVAPWYLAVYARHGRVFIDELVMRHMLGRALDHLHDTNAAEDVGIAYFVKQLGYATFPWSGVAVVAALGVPMRDDASRRSLARTVLFGATLGAFALVSSMRTKFHHYGLIVLPGAAMIAGMWLDERASEAASATRGTARASASALAFAAAALLVALVARDLGTGSADGHAPGGAARLIQLMTYRYDRRWPSTEAFAPAITALGVASALACASMASRRWRAPAVVAFAGCAVLFSALLVDVYLVAAAPDGGQRDVIAAFYRSRGASGAPLVAYQLNWKGENFYTGNNVALFIASGAPMRAYLEARKKRGEGTVYFVTERGRVAGLRNELGSVRSFAELTDRAVSHEFSLVRADL